MTTGKSANQIFVDGISANNGSAAGVASDGGNGIE